MRRIEQRDVGRYTHRVVTFVEGAAISVGKALFDTVLVVVVSIYMLLGMDRLRARRSTGASRRTAGCRCSCGSSTRSPRTCAGSSSSA